MENHYYNATDLNKFGSIGEYQKPMADKFFAWYGEVFGEGTEWPETAVVSASRSVRSLRKHRDRLLNPHLREYRVLSPAN